MAFGKSAIMPKTNGDGVRQSEKFFPSMEGEYFFRLFPGETEVKFLERTLKVKVNGNDAWRSVILNYDNIFDNKNREQQDGMTQEERDASNFLWSSKRFAINVLDRTDNVVRILKGSWNRQTNVDSEGNLLAVEGKSTHAKILRLNKAAVRTDPTTGKVLRLPVDEFDVRLVISGKGLAKEYSLYAGFDTDPLSPELLALPRYDLESWIAGAVWSNDALEELVSGEDYYQLAVKYGIELYPKLRATEEIEELEEVATAVEDDDLFND